MDNIDNNQQEEEEEEEVIGNLLQDIKQLWINERLSPDLLPYDNEKIGIATSKMQEREDILATITSDPLVVHIYEMEKERIKYIVRSYLRTRLQKIERYNEYLLMREETRKRMSEFEIIYCTKYNDLVKNHFNQSFLSNLGDDLKRVDSDKSCQKPITDNYVFCTPNGNVGQIEIDEESFHSADQSSKKVQAKQGTDDLVMLPKISEEEIVENLKKRYMNDFIYTNIGPVLISVNPFRNLGNAGDDYVDAYRGKHAQEVPPHLYQLAESAYRAMKNDQENQCVIISGESGAGKTEAAKMIMNYISKVSGGTEKVEYVKHVILESNPLLEAFGNAKTLRNNNSSRFGKYFEIQFDKAGDPVGGKIYNYLLEKSRVVYQNHGERNFHIFYQLLAGASAQEKRDYVLSSPDQFYYLNQSECYTVDGIDDAADYREVRHAMEVIGLSAEEQSILMRLVACVLHIGNIYFIEDDKGNAVVYDPNALELAASMLCIDSATLQNAILFRVINTGGAGGGTGNRRSTYNVPQNVGQASGARDALARTIYDRMFSWLVERVNVALSYYQSPFANVIGILDIFGFEIFERNGFEQFCINFVNEKLQQFFIELTLKAEQEEYVKEGIKWEPIKYFNNQIVCDLIEGKQPPGIFSLLDDICSTLHAQSTGTDQKFLEKMAGVYDGHLHWRCMTGAFAVKHYAGEVTYEAEGFSDKNKDTLFFDLIEAIQTSKMAFLTSLFPEDTGSLQKKRPTTAGFKIKNSAAELMKALSACTPHYIRCIKPNETKKAKDWEGSRVRHQVQYLGLLENVRVRRAGFAYRAPFERFLRRYKKLSSKTWGLWGEWKGDAKEGAKTICQDLNLDASQWQLGVTKIFVRHPESVFHLEEMLDRKDYDCVVRIQKAFRNWKAKKHSLEQRAQIAHMFKDKKERQRNSIERKFTADYIDFDNQFGVQAAMDNAQKKERIVFADNVTKVDRRAKTKPLIFVASDQAIYFVEKSIKKKQEIFTLLRRVALRDIRAVSISTLSDNYVVFGLPEFDQVIENDKKTELIIVLVEYYKILTGSALNVQFSDNINYTLKKNAQHGISFSKNEMANPLPIIKKGGKGLTVGVATGLPASTDSTPRNYNPNSMAQSAPRQQPQQAGRGRGMPQQGGSSAPQGGAQQAPRQMPVPQMGGGAAGGNPMGRGGLPQQGGAGRGMGTPQQQQGGAGRGMGMPQQGGAGRGMPQQGGAGRGGPQQGGGAPRPAPPAAKPAAPKLPTAKALYDYDATSQDELTFKEGDVLTIVQKSDGWWECDLRGRKGWCPANYLQA
ncbi:myosin IB [Cavenderia fasciculata]|uniref:Myosin IB n=1 Tax=Cavenderia fasciculata TaxID=261658 RepID=F4QE03_CACFS|nr:myosin IB [Cavenderia fasciculata]EGG13950.1 myosin IB [Cavenderia fasciculata]|eukprot:XP_004350658.1 myosin IB [Cavenderia fasciculata]